MSRISARLNSEEFYTVQVRKVMNHLPNDNNPYSIVREEKWSEDCNGIHIVHTKSYDANDRVVGISTVKFRGEENIGHCAQYVEAGGYWHGGAYDAEIGMGCQVYQPFVEGEIL